MNKSVARLVVLILLTILLIPVGCSRDEAEKKPVADAKKLLSRIVVPEEVEGQWKAVRIVVQNKEDNREDTYTVDIGYKFKVANSDVTLEVNAFLPAFVMKGKDMTSNSNKLDNPAALISLTEDGKEIFNGWLFSRFPGTHAFQHPKFSFTLVDFIPAQPKKG